MPKKSARTNRQQTQNTCSPSYHDIPNELKPFILNFLSPAEALPGITTSKDNIQNLSNYIIKRLRGEKLAYQIINSAAHTIAIRKDGSIITWGHNNWGQLGLGHSNNQHTQQRIPHDHFHGKTILSIHIECSRNLVRCTDDSLFSWGQNMCGQLGLGHNNDQNTPEQIDPIHFQDKIIQSIHMGYTHTLVRCSDGALFSWGFNDYGQLGLGRSLGNTVKQNTPQRIPQEYFQGKTIQSIFSGCYHTLALCTDGSLFAWGMNHHGQLGLGHNNNQNIPQPINMDYFQAKTIQSINAAGIHTLALCTDGSLYTWGFNNCGQLGLGHNNNQNTPQLIDSNHFHGKTIQSIHIGEDLTLARCADGTLFTWGRNEYGQLGLGHNNNRNTPQRIPKNYFQGHTIQFICTGTRHTLARCTDGSLFAWGWNVSGQLGLGHTNNQNTPQLIDSNHFQGKTIQSIHKGNNHTLVLCTNGTLFAWGNNEFGRLGLGHNDNELIPTQLPDPLERAFRTGHQRLNSTSFFSNTSVDPTTRFLSGSVLHPNETDRSRIESSTSGMATQKQVNT